MALTTKKPPGDTQLKFAAMGDGLIRSSHRRSQKKQRSPVHRRSSFSRSSSTPDADFFIVMRIFTGDLKEIVFQGAIDPHTPVAQGWLRASHRKLDKKLSKPYRPYHTHDEKRPLKKGQQVELDIEIWPTSIVVPAGYRVGLSIRGKRLRVWRGEAAAALSNFKNELKGCGPFLHDDPRDRPPAIFNGTTSLSFWRAKAPYLLLLIIPPKSKQAGESRSRRADAGSIQPRTAAI